MSLHKKQVEFTKAKGQLIIYAFANGYELTDGDAYRDSRVFGQPGQKKGYGSKNSVHKLRLAQDFNLFVDGKLIRNSEHQAWANLHLFWSTLGGAEAIPNDAGHFSFEWHGRR